MRESRSPGSVRGVHGNVIFLPRPVCDDWERVRCQGEESRGRDVTYSPPQQNTLPTRGS